MRTRKNVFSLAPVLVLAACGGAPDEPPQAPPQEEKVAFEAAPQRVTATRTNLHSASPGLLDGALPLADRDVDTEAYAKVLESGFFATATTPLSTFAADVDTAAYANTRRFLKDGKLPPKDAVRVEDFVNAQDYRNPPPQGNDVFAVTTELGGCPWQQDHQLLRVALRTRAINAAKVPPCNLVFLLDVSGSMEDPDKLPLVQRAMTLLVDQLRPQDRVAIVTYANGVQVPLETARGDEQERIDETITNLESGGSTNGAGGIQKAYEIALANKIPEGANRVILCTDGDFNVGISSPDELERFIESRRDDGVFLTVLGVGTGNLKDDRLERLANKGNGVYAYLDTPAEARAMLVDQFGASMTTLAKDVKLQFEFDPAAVAGYRLIGYENRTLDARDFRDDKKDAGELGAGHAMTALYEIVPLGVPVPGAPTDAAAGSPPKPTAETLGKLHLRFKAPLGDKAREQSFPVAGQPAAQPSRDQRLAAAAAAFGMLLRQSQHLGQFGWNDLAAMVDAADLESPGLRQMVDRARELAR